MIVVWRKSSHSGTQTESECVEVAGLSGGSARIIGVRDSKNPRGPVLTFTRREFRVLLDHAMANPRIRA